MNSKRIFAAVAAITLFGMAAPAAYAQPSVQTVLLPDGSTVAFTNNSRTRFFGPSTAQSATFHCNPNCSSVNESAASEESVANTLLRPVTTIGAAAAFGHNLPRNVASTTNVSQTGGGASASAQQTQDQGQLAGGGDAVNVNTPTTINANLNVPIANGGEAIAFGGSGGNGTGGNAQTVGANSCNTGSLATGGCQ